MVPPRPSIFVSYSHTDGNLVQPVVALLRASQALVFRDADSLQPGKKWREQLASAIADSRIVLVFWCRHAHSSVEVRKEYVAAIAQDKDVLPVLLDDTPLPPELDVFQAIDFRAAFPAGHAGGHGGVGGVAASPARAAAGSMKIALVLASLAVFVVSAVVAWGLLPARPQDPTPGDPLPHPAPPPVDANLSLIEPALIAMFVVALCALAYLLIRRRRRQGPKGQDEAAQHALAHGIEEELRRRLVK